MIYKDYHIHSEFSGDSNQNIEELIEHCISIGLKEIAITDHSEYGIQDMPPAFILNYSQYNVKIQELQEKYRKKICLRYGVEVGMDVQVKEYFEKNINSYPFDFIIGSNHAIHSLDIASSNITLGKTKQELQELYFQTLLHNIQNYHDFCVLGHMDFITRYGGEKFRGLNLKENWDIIQTILQHLIKYGKGIEINTSGFRYHEERFYPLPEIVKEYLRLGGEIITVGSDAHIQSHIAMDFQRVEDFLRSINYPYIASFEKRKAIIEKI